MSGSMLSKWSGTSRFWDCGCAGVCGLAVASAPASRITSGPPDRSAAPPEASILSTSASFLFRSQHVPTLVLPGRLFDGNSPTDPPCRLRETVALQDPPGLSNRESPANEQVAQRAMHVLRDRNPGAPEGMECTVRESDMGGCWRGVTVGNGARVPPRGIPTMGRLPVCCPLPADLPTGLGRLGEPQYPGNVVGPLGPAAPESLPPLSETVGPAG